MFSWRNFTALNTRTFKQRVIETVTAEVENYKRTFIDYEYLIVSKSFVQRPYYILSGTENNYLHLTGIQTSLSPQAFFAKCITNTLMESDINLENKQNKGTVRKKINVLGNLNELFEKELLFEEDFSKNTVQCALAAVDNTFTIGYSSGPKGYPKTLLKGNELNNIVLIDFILKRKKGSHLFNSLVKGNIVPDQLTDEVKTLIDSRILTSA